MRKWHRWITVFFGVFMFWIAATGVLSHVAALWPAGAPSPEAAARATPPEGWACPEGWRCSPPRETSGMRSLVGLFHHLHSGETFGPVGTAISVRLRAAVLRRLGPVDVYSDVPPAAADRTQANVLEIGASAPPGAPTPFLNGVTHVSSSSQQDLQALRISLGL